jgi:hypothetical protein
MENELFEWFCSAYVNSIALDRNTAKEEAHKITLKMGIEF